MRTKTWISCVCMSTMALVLVPLLPSSSSVSADLQPATANAREMAAFQELSRRLRTEPPATPETEALRERSEASRLFRGYLGTEANQRQLEGVPYGTAIFKTAERYQLDSLLLAALVEAESNFQPGVVSPRGAIGLTQVLPSTASEMGIDDLSNPLHNLDAGARYLSLLLKRFEGDLELALAAYNAGPGSVERFGGMPPYSETQRYVDKVLDIYVAHYKQAWQTSVISDLLPLQQ